MSNDATIKDASTPQLEEELRMRTWAEEKLIKLGSLLEIGESRNVHVEDAISNYDKSREMLYKDKNSLESIKESDKGMRLFTMELNQLMFKFFGLPRWSYLSFVFAIYGLSSMV